MDLSQSLFWIRGYNVPIGFRTQKVATMIEGALGEFVEWDGREESWLGLFICIKVMIDISKPLRKGLQLKLGGKKPRRLRVKYDRLSNFCYACGRMDHVLKECEEPGVEVDDEDYDNYPFSPDLSPPPPKPKRCISYFQ